MLVPYQEWLGLMATSWKESKMNHNCNKYGSKEMVKYSLGVNYTKIAKRAVFQTTISQRSGVRELFHSNLNPHPHE